MAEFNPYNFLYLDDSEAVKVAKQTFKKYNVEDDTWYTDEYILSTIAYKLDTDTMSTVDKQGGVDYSYLCRAALLTLYHFAITHIDKYKIKVDDPEAVYRLTYARFDVIGELPEVGMTFTLESGAGIPKLNLKIAYEKEADKNTPGLPVGESKAYVKLCTPELSAAGVQFVIIYLSLKQLSPIRSIFDAIGRVEKSKSMKRAYKTVN